MNDKDLMNITVEATLQKSGLGQGRKAGGANGNFNVRADDGFGICTTTYSHSIGYDGKHAAGERIAAMWNACYGMPVEEIKKLGVGGATKALSQQ